MENIQTATVKIAKALKDAGIPMKFILPPLRQPSDKEKECEFGEFGVQKYYLCDDGSNVEMAIKLTNSTREVIEVVGNGLSCTPKDTINLGPIHFARWIVQPNMIITFHTDVIRIVQYR